MTLELIDKINKDISCAIEKENDEERSFTAIASTEDVDRDGDIIRASGWKLKNFKKNPVFLWGHDNYSLPIGTVKDVWVENEKLMFMPVFATEEMNPFADKVYRMFQKKFLRSFSVRFDPLEWAEIKPDDGKGITRFGREYKKQELLEISAVSIPANPGAVALKELADFAVKSYIAEHARQFKNVEVVNNMLRKTYIVVPDIPMTPATPETPEIPKTPAATPIKSIDEKREALKKLQEEKSVIEKDNLEETEEKEIDAQINQLRGEIEDLKLVDQLEEEIKNLSVAISGLK